MNQKLGHAQASQMHDGAGEHDATLSNTASADKLARLRVAGTLCTNRHQGTGQKHAQAAKKHRRARPCRAAKESSTRRRPRRRERRRGTARRHCLSRAAASPRGSARCRRKGSRCRPSPDWWRAQRGAQNLRREGRCHVTIQNTGQRAAATAVEKSMPHGTCRTVQRQSSSQPNALLRRMPEPYRSGRTRRQPL